jgi:DNA invertase Pin-like site-specific DNA recombinase
MNFEVQVASKVTASHLKREAFLYVRQSTLRQVFENQESTKRQYALRQRAVALGWSAEDVVVIDDDLGQSGATTAGREGFQRLVAEVGMGRVGIVLGLEVSRLARNCSDWHRLLELCALSGTLILDEDGVYNPCDFNDRLLLGLKGTMSEAELHILRARLRGGILAKAKRGELLTPLPVGLVYDARDRVILDPDQQVQQSIHHFFATYRRLGAARTTVMTLRKEKALMPRRIRFGVQKGELIWGQICYSRALQMLHNPRYAGAFFYGRSRTRKLATGSVKVDVLPRDQWHTLLLDAHPGYITWEEYQTNQRQLLECAKSQGTERLKSPPREGPALLQGMVVCGKCGRRMSIRYHQRGDRLHPCYVCQLRGIERGQPICESIPGADIDHAVGVELVAMVSPVALEVALAVQHELTTRIEEADRLRYQQVERARYEADLARRRFMQVDPSNRLVADSLEGEWNDRLRAHAEAQQEYERQGTTDRQVLSDEQRQRVLALATDFPKLWQSPTTTMRDRKRMIRLLVEDVTLLRKDGITVHVRFKGGVAKTFQLPTPKRAWELRQHSQQVVDEVDRLLDDHTDRELAEALNQRGYVTGVGLAFTARTILLIRRAYQLRSRYQRLREAGLLTLGEIATLLKVNPGTVKTWRDHGLLRAQPYNDKNECLYQRPGPNAPTKQQGTKLSLRRLDARQSKPY